MEALQGAPPHKACWGYKRPQAPPDPKRRDFPRSCSLHGCFMQASSLLQTHFYTQNTQKTNQSLLILLFTKNTRYCSYTQPSFPWFYNSDLRFKGYGCSCLATIHTPFFFKASSSFNLACSWFNNMIYCFT